MKIQLIQPSTGEYKSNSRSGCYPPLGLVSIATYIKKECPYVEIEIMDGELSSDDEMIERLDADIIGLSTNTVNYPQAIKIAAIAKNMKSRVVLGGVYASCIPELIFSKRHHIIDTIVIGQGEKPMVDIIRGNSSRIIINHKPEFNSLPFPDRSVIHLEDYVNIFQESHPTWKFRATNIFTNVGCNWKEKSKGGCVFCSRSGKVASYRNPQSIWQEIRELEEEYGIDYVVDFSDTILQDIGWLTELVKLKPYDLNPKWHIFARIDEINNNTLKLINHLPCCHIFVGMESGDPMIYKRVKKGGGSPEDGLKIARLLHQYNIELTPSYVIGLPGETEESLKKTLDHARTLHDIIDFEEMFCCELIPFPGSRAFSLLQSKVNLDSDVLDVEYLKKLWIKHFCPIDYRLIEEYTSKILELAKYKITIIKNPHSALRGCAFWELIHP